MGGAAIARVIDITWIYIAEHSATQRRTRFITFASDCLFPEDFYGKYSNIYFVLFLVQMHPVEV